MAIIVSARDLQVGDALPGRGRVVRILPSKPDRVAFVIDAGNGARPTVVKNHGDPVRIHREEA